MSPPPRNKQAILEQLRGLLAHLLKAQPSEEVDRIPLVELGVNSLTMMEMVRAVDRQMGVKVQVRQLFRELATLEALAEHVAEHSAEQGTEHMAEWGEEPEPEIPRVRGAAGGRTLLASPESGLEGILKGQLEAVARSLGEVVERQLRAFGKDNRSETLLDTPGPGPETQARAREGQGGDSTSVPSSQADSSPSLPPWKVREHTSREMEARQREYLGDFTRRYCQRTPGSKTLADRHRGVLADNRASAGFRFTTKELLYPIVGRRAKGSRIWDVDENEYLDLTMGFGVYLFGHHPPFVMEAMEEQLREGIQLGPQAELAGEVAGAICAMTGAERAAFCNTGTEAVMTALRLARAVTGRSKVALFSNSYHGHFDGTLGVPSGPDDPRALAAVPGTLQGMVDDVLVLEYGDPRSLEIIRSRASELAAVLVEPVQSRRPDLQPRQFLHDLAAITRAGDVALVFDEMITGFRVHPGGAQAWFGVEADIGVYGKVVGGGMPIGVVAGQSRFLDALDGGVWRYGDDSYPEAETTFFAGTFNKHPLTLAAAQAVLQHLKDQGPGLQEGLNQKTEELAGRLNQLFEREQAPIQAAHFGSLFRLNFTQNLDLLFYHLLAKGVYVWEGRNCFLSTAHTPEDLDDLVEVVEESLKELRGGGYIAPMEPARDSGASGEADLAATEGPAEAPARDDASAFPLSEAQQQVWVQSEMSTAGSLAYNITSSLSLQGDLRQELLEEAIQRLVERHEGLRITIDPDGQTQRVRAGFPGPVLERIRPDGAVEDPDEAVRKWLEKEEGKRLFDLAQGPLYRFTLLDLGPARHVLVLSVHHIAVDGWSVGILIRELSELYTALAQGVPWEAGPALSFRQYLKDREVLEGSPEMARHEEFWLDVFKDIPQPLELPGDAPRPAKRSFSGRRRTSALPQPLARRVLEVSAQEGATPFMTMLAAYVALLSRLSGNKDLAVGVPVGARTAEEGWDLVGYCTNMIPLRCSVDSAGSFSGLLAHVREAWMEASEHQDLPLSGLIRKLEIPYDPSSAPLVSVLFNLDQAASAPRFGELKTKWVSTPIRHAVFDLFLNVIQQDASLTLECDASEDLFDSGTVDRILGMYLRLLEVALEEPQALVSDLPLLTHGQERRLASWNATSTEVEAAATVLSLFAEAARKNPDAVAVVDGPRRLTYGELDDRAERLAGLLRSRGVGPDTPVGVCMPRSLEMIVGILAVLKAGGAYLPLDPAHPPRRLHYMLTNSRVPLVLAHGEVAGRIPETGAEVIVPEAEELTGERVGGVEVEPHHLAYVMYTSGSTGQPKGVMVEHRNLVNLVQGLRDRIFQRYDGPLRVALVASVVFDASVQQIFSTLLQGHELWIVPDEIREDGGKLAAYLADNGIHVADGTPTHLRMLVESAGSNGRSLGPRHLIIGGEEMPPATVRELLRRYPQAPPVITNIYGPTECCVDNTAFELSAETVGGLERVPIGAPMANQRVHILDEGLRRTPIGVVGEICIAGGSVGRGYHHDDALTAERFLQSHPADPGRLYRTGDLGRWRNDGTIDFLGRLDHLVKIRGHRVELGEIENALLEFRGLALPVLDPRAESRAAIRRCSRCVLPEDFPEISFDEEGVCSVCREYEEYRDAADAYFGDPEGFREVLDTVLEGKGREYDCMLLYSGGKDSSYVLYRLLDMGLRVITFTLDNGYISQSALESIRRTTSRLGIESIVQTVPNMDACFAESLSADHTVCTGCFRALTALSTRAAMERDVDVVVTGLSRGQVLDTKLSGLLRQGIRDPEEMEERLRVHRRMYHRRNDAIAQILDIDLDDAYLDGALFADYFRYDETDEAGVLSFLGQKDPEWAQPRDTGFCSSNCLINDVGIAVHLSNRGYHNYAAPMSWECRLGLRTREDALASLRLNPDQGGVAETLASVYADASPVQAAVVTDRTDPSGHKTLCAYLVARRKFSMDTLRRHLAQRLPDYMIPSQIVLLDRMPLTSSGKVDRKALPEPEAIRDRDASRAAPRTPTEELVAGIWQEVLGVPVVGRDDNFFELGGHSISAIQVVVRARELFSLQLPTRVVFEHPVLADLCGVLDGLRRTGVAEPPPPLTRTAPAGEAPLSFAQQRLWFLDQLEGESAAYNVPGALRIRGPLDVPALEKAVLGIVQRHETLRTTFPERGGEPVQAIAPQGTVALDVVNLTEMKGEAKGDEIRRRSARVATTPFDLSRGPLLRLELLHLGDEEHVLLTAMHHIVSDGWSFGVFARELAALYGESTDLLPDLEIQYADWARWEREWLTQANLEPRMAYWRERLAGAPTLLPLPTDRPRPPVQSFRGATHHATIGGEQMAALRALAGESGATLFMSVLGVFLALLHRYTHETDIVVGTPVANRSRRELEPLIGFFVNTLALRVGVEGEGSFRELLGRVRDVALDAFAHHDTPFERVVDELELERNLSHQPLFQVMFILQNTPAETLAIPGLELEPMELDTPTAKFDLTLAVREEAHGGLALEWEYNTDLFDADTIVRMAHHFRTLLDVAAQDPDRPLVLLPMVPQEEHQALLQAGSGPQMEIPEGSLLQLFQEKVAVQGDRVAVVGEEGSLDYRSLDTRAQEIARLLAHHGVGPGELVGVCLERSPDLVAALLGVLKLGAAYVPMDPAFPRARLGRMISDAGVRVVVGADGEETGWMAESHGATVVDPGSPAPDDPSPLPGAGSPDDLAYVIYTSGSTGRPKGVEITHGALVNFLRAMAGELELSGDDMLLAVTTVSFDIAALELFLPLVTGGTVHLASAERAGDGRALASLMEETRPTIMQATPATWKMLLEAGWKGDEAMSILCGGEALPGGLARRLRGMGRVLVNLYGPTETTIWSALHRVEEVPEDSEHSVSIGRPIANTGIHILAPGTVEPVPTGVPGELCISGAGVARGYRGQPELTAEKFVDDPFAGDGGGTMYRTGDLARYRSDGTLEFLGRTDNQVKLRGYRIEPGEVEEALESHGAVESAVVAPRGESLEDRRLVAWIVPRLGERPAEVTTEQLDQWQQVWDEVYTDGSPAPDASFDISGWHDSIRGEAIPDQEMQEWVETTTRRLRALNPERVLEIGCGTGLMVARLAPHCREYLATDFSPAALESVARLCRERPGLEHVRTEQRAADELGGMEAGDFDLIILNSVVQYFPGREYLLDVLGEASRLVRPGGSIFLGDLRNLRLLEAFHLSVLLPASPGELEVGDLSRRLASRMAEEEELLLDPDFIAALPGLVPGVTGAGVLLRRGSFHNELTRYRFDALLRVGAPTDEPGEEKSQGLPEMAWGELDGGLPELARRLGEEGLQGMGVRDIPNLRLSGETRALGHLRVGGGTVAEMRGSLVGEVQAVDPETLWSMGEEEGYDVAVTWAASGDPGSCDAFFRKANGSTPDPWGCVPGGGPDGERPVGEGAFPAGANDPLRGKLIRRLVPELRSHLEKRLPAYMVPAAFVMLDELPLTPNRKVDRKALPDPELLGALSTRDYTAPATATESCLAEIFARVLGLPRAGARDSFFELGGHSLLATQVVSRIREEMGLEIPVRRLFEAPTVADLARHLDALTAAALQEEAGEGDGEEREEGVV